MSRRVRVGLICVLLVAFACERDHATGIGDAAPLVAEYERALERLDEVVDALAVGSSTPEALLAGPEADTIPEEAFADLNRIGETAARVTFSIRSERSASTGGDPRSRRHCGPCRVDPGTIPARYRCSPGDVAKVNALNRNKTKVLAGEIPESVPPATEQAPPAERAPNTPPG